MSERTHRHQLEKNILADWLSEKIEILKPYGRQLAIGGLVLLAAIIGAVWYFSRTDVGTPKAWQAYLFAFGEQKVAEALQDVYQEPEVAGTAAGLWARLSFADQKFRLAALQGAQDPEEAKTALVDAEKALIEVEKKATNPALLARTRFTLARVYETQSKLNKAREYYQKVAEGGKDSALGKAAAEGVERLDPKGDAAQVLTWLAEHKPLAAKTPGNNSFLDSLGPGFGQPAPSLPERPNLNVPGAGSPFGPSGAGGIDFGRDDPLGLKGDAPPASELNADPEAKASDTPPPEEKPAVEKPTKEKAADESAAVKKPAETDKPSEKADE